MITRIGPYQILEALHSGERPLLNFLPVASLRVHALLRCPGRWCYPVCGDPDCRIDRGDWLSAALPGVPRRGVGVAGGGARLAAGDDRYQLGHRLISNGRARSESARSAMLVMTAPARSFVIRSRLPGLLA